MQAEAPMTEQTVAKQLVVEFMRIVTDEYGDVPAALLLPALARSVGEVLGAAVHQAPAGAGAPLEDLLAVLIHHARAASVAGPEGW